MISPLNLLLVGTGGMLGSVLRFLLAGWMNNRSIAENGIPWGTVAVNVVGSLVIGLVMGYAARNADFDHNWRIFLATGLCGGFTTFSALSNEMYMFLKEQQYAAALVYIAASLLLGIGATALGYLISK